MSQHQYELNELIKNKFGSLAKFSRIAGRDWYFFQKILSRKHPAPGDLEMVKKLVYQLSPDGTDPDFIGPQHLAKIKENLYSRYSSVNDFCQSHKKFAGKKESVYRLLQGRHKRVNQFVKDICKTLKVKI